MNPDITQRPDRADARDVADGARRLNNQLARTGDIRAPLINGIVALANCVTAVDWHRWMKVDAERTTFALTALVDAQSTLLQHADEMAIRIGVGRALARFSHALQLIAEVEPVAADRSPKELARWLAETVEISNAALAGLAGVSNRTFRCWASPLDRTEPRPEETDRLRVLAKVVNQVRFSLTAKEILRWFNTPNCRLESERPRDLLEDPLAGDRLIRAATSLRYSVEDDRRLPMSEGAAPDVPAELIEVLAPVVRSFQTIQAWFTSPEPELLGHSPASWLSTGRDRDAVLEQARRYASRLSH